ncbi:MAG: hypothetical protein WCI61_03890 [Chloroflexota bacterium]
MNRTAPGYVVLSLVPSAPSSGERLQVSAQGLTPGTYTIWIGVPQTEGGSSVGRTIVGADGALSVGVTMLEGVANDRCIAVAAIGEGKSYVSPSFAPRDSVR